MTAYKTFFKITKSYSIMIVIYSILLIFFTGFSMSTTETTEDFIASKPDIVIINNDSSNDITNNLIDYLDNNTNVRSMNEDEINDALFYRDIDYAIYIPKNYYNDYMDGLNPKINIKTINTYQSILAENILNRYIKIANIYQNDNLSEKQIITNINNSLKEITKIEVVSKLNVNVLNKMNFYYNFLNYSILAGCVYVICLILSCYKEDKIRKRITVSSTDYKKINRQLLIGNGILIFILWFIYNVLAFIIIGKDLLTAHGLIYILNSFIFTFCSLTLAFLFGNLITNKNAINGIINVTALGTSFLCGAFVSAELLPPSVLKIAHIFPSYWYINSNNLIKTLEVINIDTLSPVLKNMLIIFGFSVLFIISANIVSKCKRKAE